MQDPPPDALLRDALVRSWEAGAAGEPPDEQLRHSERFLPALRAVLGDDDGPVLDLGSGGGVPGLPLAVWLPRTRWILVDSRERRAVLLTAHAELLEITDRVSVRWGRAEEIAREESLREQASVVVARSFGGPAETAECAVGFLRTGGHLLVSEPPGSSGERWDRSGLEVLGLSPVKVNSGVMIIQKVAPTGEGWPRRTGRARKRPLF